MTRISVLRSPERPQAKLNRLAKFSTYGRSCVIRTSSVAIRRSTTICFILRFGVPIAHIASEYETPVLDEIEDVFSATNKDVEFVLKGKTFKLRTPHGRTIKAHLVEGKQC